MSSHQALAKEHQCRVYSSIETGLSEVKLPKVSVPTFDGISWKSFWEQFHATIHSKPGLNDTAKFIQIHARCSQGWPG